MSQGISDWNYIDWVKVVGTNASASLGKPGALPPGLRTLYYEPDTNANGPDSFAYGATDCAGSASSSRSVEAEVRLDVIARDDPPFGYIGPGAGDSPQAMSFSGYDQEVVVHFPVSDPDGKLDANCTTIVLEALPACVMVRNLEPLGQPGTYHSWRDLPYELGLQQHTAAFIYTDAADCEPSSTACVPCQPLSRATLADGALNATLPEGLGDLVDEIISFSPRAAVSWATVDYRLRNELCPHSERTQRGNQTEAVYSLPLVFSATFEQTTAASKGLGSDMIAIIMLLALATLAAVGLCVWSKRRANTALVARLSETGRPPVLTLHPSHTWHLFLSHTWGTGQDRVSPRTAWSRASARTSTRISACPTTHEPRTCSLTPLRAQLSTLGSRPLALDPWLSTLGSLPAARACSPARLCAPRERAETHGLKKAICTLLPEAKIFLDVCAAVSSP